MSERSLNEDDLLEDFDPREITLDGVTKVVHVTGTGPAVIVMAEMPGISPHVARFGRWVRDAGFTVYMPSLFGRDGAVPGVEEGTAVFQRACVSAEFRAFAGKGSSPVTHAGRSGSLPMRRRSATASSPECCPTARPTPKRRRSSSEWSPARTAS